VHIEQEKNRYPLRGKDSTEHASHVASEYAAVFPTRLALARWTRGGDTPHVFASAHNVPMRAAWYGQAQRQFQAWLEDGGFHAD